MGGSKPKQIFGGVKRLGQSAIDYTAGISTLDLGRATRGISSAVGTLGEMTGLVKRPGEKDTPQMDMSPGVETPSPGKVTEEQNDAIRQRLGKKFAASRLLFGGGGGLDAKTKTSSTSLLGF